MTEPRPMHQLDPDDEVTIDGIELLGETSHLAEQAIDAEETIDGAELVAELRSEQAEKEVTNGLSSARSGRWRPPIVDQPVQSSARATARTLNLVVVALVFALCLAGSWFV